MLQVELMKGKLSLTCFSALCACNKLFLVFVVYNMEKRCGW